MAKFMHLVGNEWKKQFYKKGIWVMLILLALATLGYTLIVSSMNSASIRYDYLQQECEWEIEEFSQYINQTDADGNLTDFAMECRFTVEKAEFWLEIGATYDDWRYTSGIYDEMIAVREEGNTALYESIRSFMVNNDTEAYFRYQKQREMTEADGELRDIRIRHWDYCLENDLIPDNNPQYQISSLRAMTAERVLLYERRIASGSMDPESVDYMKARDDLAIYNYMIENGQFVNPAKDLDSSLMNGSLSGQTTFWSALAASDDLTVVIGVFLIIIAGGIVANEFAQGTIKFLLVSPVKRWKLLMSKYTTVFFMGLLMLGVTLGFGFLGSLVGGIGYGGSEQLTYLAIYAENGVAYTASPYLKILSQYLLGCVEIVVMFSLAFAISSLLRSSAVAIGVSLFAMLSGSILVSLLLVLEQDWARYLIFANLDLEVIINGSSLFPHHSLLTALTVIVLHMVVFLWTAIDGFVRREV